MSSTADFVPDVDVNIWASPDVFGRAVTGRPRRLLLLAASCYDRSDASFAPIVASDRSVRRFRPFARRAETGVPLRCLPSCPSTFGSWSRLSSCGWRTSTMDPPRQVTLAEIGRVSESTSMKEDGVLKDPKRLVNELVHLWPQENQEVPTTGTERNWWKGFCSRMVCGEPNSG